MSRFLLFILVVGFLASGITPIHVGCPAPPGDKIFVIGDGKEVQTMSGRSKGKENEERFRAAFDKIDTDGNQELTHEETKDIAHAETFFGIFETNEDGKITYEEYKKGIKTMIEAD